MKVVAVVSGGMDSVTLAYKLKAAGEELHLLSFDYGQKHVKELAFARMAADRLRAKHSLANLTSLKPILRGSALTDASLDVPEGHYTEPSMRSTVVPNRNAILLSVAFALAVSDHADAVAIGVHAGDHPIYPDCRPEFIESFEFMERVATKGFAAKDLRLLAPFIDLRKHDIAAIGDSLAVPWLETWSCYVGRERHCGRCGTCVERREAFRLAKIVDPTPYAP